MVGLYTERLIHGGGGLYSEVYGIELIYEMFSSLLRKERITWSFFCTSKEKSCFHEHGLEMWNQNFTVVSFGPALKMVFEGETKNLGCMGVHD